METAIQLNQVRPKQINQSDFVRFESSINTENAPFEVLETKPLVSENKPHRNHFIEANTTEVSLTHLQSDCVVPVFSKDNEITISHSNFIQTVQEAANKFFFGETIDTPEVRVSHIVKGRTPDAIYKPVNELLESEKTIFYERMAFCFEIPTIYEDFNGNRLNLTIGGVRAYNHENLYSKKSSEKFKVFIGFKNLVCCNMCISTDGFKTEIKAMSVHDLTKAVIALFEQYNPAKQLHLMSALKDSYLTEHQFAQLVGKTKLYNCLPPAKRKLLPNLDFTDTHINMVAKSYYSDENFAKDDFSGDINLWKVYNLFTGANKSSYIDNFLDRSVNATELIQGINSALYGDNSYKWFIE
ncbi:MAG: DUF3871 family protein [Bacteroidota bacterium]